VGSTLVADISAALDIAATLDMHIKLTLFSFNDFYADYTDSGLTIVGLQPSPPTPPSGPHSSRMS